MGMKTSGVKVVVPDKKVWVSWIDAADAKPGTINSGFRYGQEIAIVCDPKGGLFALSNKMPPTGRPTSPSDIPVFPVRKQGGSVQVQINVNAKAQFESKYWRGVLDAQGKVDGGYY